MKNIWTIMRKELARVFKNPKLAFTTFLMPGLLLFLLYSLMGNAITSNFANQAAGEITVYERNIPAEFKTILDETDGVVVKNLLVADEANVKEALNKNNGVDLIIIFDESFQDKIDGGEKPLIEYYVNPNEQKSTRAEGIIVSLLSHYEVALLEVKGNETSLFNVTPIFQFDERLVIAKALSLLLPFLILTFLFQGATSVGIESIAGEKERGTMATLLVTPSKRSHIALGKIFSLTILATLSAISSFIGILLSLPKVLGQEANVGLDFYSFGDYALILVVLVSTVLVIVGLVAVISAYAKNMKEASVLVMPLMIISMVCGITSMISSSASTNTFVYLIPIYNSVQILLQLFTFSLDITQLLICLGINLVFVGGLAYLLTKMFNNETIMFAK